MSEVFIQEETISGTVNATDVYVGDDVVKSVNDILPDKDGKLKIFIPELDATLTLPNKAADAKAVGDLLTKLRADIPTVPENVSAFNNDACYVTEDDLESRLEPVTGLFVCDVTTGEVTAVGSMERLMQAFEEGRAFHLFAIMDDSDAILMLQPLMVSRTETETGTEVEFALVANMGLAMLAVIFEDAEWYCTVLDFEQLLGDAIENASVLLMEVGADEDYTVHSYSESLDYILTAISEGRSVICKLTLTGVDSTAYLPLMSTDSEQAVFAFGDSTTMITVIYDTNGVQMHVTDNTPDWSANGTYDNGYIKNRTHSAKFELQWDGDVGDKYTVNKSDIVTLVRVSEEYTNPADFIHGTVRMTERDSDGTVLDSLEIKLRDLDGYGYHINDASISTRSYFGEVVFAAVSDDVEYEGISWRKGIYFGKASYGGGALYLDRLLAADEMLSLAYIPDLDYTPETFFVTFELNEDEDGNDVLTVDCEFTELYNAYSSGRPIRAICQMYDMFLLELYPAMAVEESDFGALALFTGNYGPDLIMGVFGENILEYTIIGLATTDEISESVKMALHEANVVRTVNGNYPDGSGNIDLDINVPTCVSELENDAGYVTEDEIIDIQDAVTDLRDELDAMPTAEPYVVLFVRDEESDEVTCNYTMADINQAKSAGRTVIAHVDVSDDGETVIVPAVILTENFALFEAVIENVIVAAGIELDSESGSGESYFCDMLEIPLRQHFRVYATANSDLTDVTVDCNWAELLKACQAESTVDCELRSEDGDNPYVIILPLIEYSNNAVDFGIVINGISVFVNVWDDEGQANAFLQYIPPEQPKKYQLIKQVETTEEVTYARLTDVRLEKVTVFVSVPGTATSDASPSLRVISANNYLSDFYIPRGISAGTALELKYVADISSGLLSMSGFSRKPNYTNMTQVVENTDCVEWTLPITEVEFGDTSLPAGTIIKIYGIEAD